MTKHIEGDDCPECRKVRALEKELNALLEQSDLSATNKAHTLLVFAMAELAGEHGPHMRHAFDALAGGMLDKLDASAPPEVH